MSGGRGIRFGGSSPEIGPWDGLSLMGTEQPPEAPRPPRAFLPDVYRLLEAAAGSIRAAEVEMGDPGVLDELSIEVPDLGSATLDGWLGQLGWEVLGQGHSRRVYGHEDCGWVLKIGCPATNRHEQDLSDWLAGQPWGGTSLDDVMPVLWTARDGVALAMRRARHTLAERFQRGHLELDTVDAVCSRFKQLGYQDVNGYNVGWDGHWDTEDGQDSESCRWRLLDLGETSRRDLENR